MTVLSPRPVVHDLVKLRSAGVEAVGGAGPIWVRDILRKCPWVVVRRSRALDRQIAIGVRGKERQERWGGYIHLGQIEQLLSPRNLRSDRAKQSRYELPALQALRFLETELSSMTLEWGPAGSVGFELASGVPVIHQGSDLDVVFCLRRPITRRFARELLAILQAAPHQVDSRIETPLGGFSLEEYSRTDSLQLLVKTGSGPVLSPDPWRPSVAGDQK